MKETKPPRVPLLVRLPESTVLDVDEWRSTKRPIPTRTAAFLQLLRLGLLADDTSAETASQF